MNIYIINEDTKKGTKLFPSTDDIKVEILPQLTDLVGHNPFNTDVAIIISNHPPKGYDIV